MSEDKNKKLKYTMAIPNDTKRFVEGRKPFMTHSALFLYTALNSTQAMIDSQGGLENMPKHDAMRIANNIQHMMDELASRN